MSSDPWAEPSTVAGFATGVPNPALMQFAGAELRRTRGRIAVDIGCGAGRNAVSLAASGWRVVGVDLSPPMLLAAADRARTERVIDRVHLARAEMDHLPLVSASGDLLIAHGIWNLARTGEEFRRGVREAARVAKPGAALFLFTFSRGTLDDTADPVPGESFVFTHFANAPHCFLTRSQLEDELGAAGFAPDPALPLRELNRRTPGMLPAAGAPVIWQGAFRYRL